MTAWISRVDHAVNCEDHKTTSSKRNSQKQFLVSAPLMTGARNMVTGAQQAAARDHGGQHQQCGNVRLLSVLLRTGSLVPAVAQLPRPTSPLELHVCPFPAAEVVMFTCPLPPSARDMSTLTGETVPIIGGRHKKWAVSTQHMSHKRGMLHT